MRKFISITILGIVFAILGSDAYSQAPKKPTSAEILLALKKLNVLGSALYVAAHPDDENTRLITYLSNERLVYAAYLSVTRGDGGQNLIGPEIREELGIIRTQELLAARRRDGGTQFFTRANDFGYSKTAEETLRFWDKDKVLADVVWAIRKFRPDVIITRFPPDSRGGHGHHTSSAILAEEGYIWHGDLKGDDLPYGIKTRSGKKIVVIPHRTMTSNDYAVFPETGSLKGFRSGEESFAFVKDFFDSYYKLGQEEYPGALTYGIHPMRSCIPDRIGVHERFFDHVRKFQDVWVARYVDIAEHWMKHYMNG